MVAPDWLVTVAITLSLLSLSSSSRASLAPSAALTDSIRDVQIAYQDFDDVTGSSPLSGRGSERPPTRGYPGAGRPGGKAGMPSLRGRPPEIRQRLPSSCI